MRVTLDPGSAAARRASGLRSHRDGGGEQALWFGDFITLIGLTEFEPGYYFDLRRFSFHNPAKGRLELVRDGTGGVVWSGDVARSIR
jgi:hypothetical protein